MLELMRLLVLIDCISKALNVLHQSLTLLKSCSSNKGYVELRTVRRDNSSCRVLAVVAGIDTCCQLVLCFNLSSA